MKKTLLTGLATMMLISSISGVAFAQESDETQMLNVEEIIDISNDNINLNSQSRYLGSYYFSSQPLYTNATIYSSYSRLNSGYYYIINAQNGRVQLATSPYSSSSIVGWIKAN